MLPFCLKTLNCSGVRTALHSDSDLVDMSKILCLVIYLLKVLLIGIRARERSITKSSKKKKYFGDFYTCKIPAQKLRFLSTRDVFDLSACQ
jgi:hypothetical protein